MPSIEHILAVKCARNDWTRNSSPTLKTFTPLFTSLRLMYSRILHSDPTSEGDPQKMVNTTRKHSQRKWKSPGISVSELAKISFFFKFYQVLHVPIVADVSVQPLTMSMLS